MSRITNYLTGAFLLFLMLSCVNDENDRIENKNTLSQLKEELHLEKFSNVNIADNVEVNWNNAHQTEKKDVAVVEFDAKEKFPSKLQSSFLKAEMNYQLISIEAEGEVKNYFIEVFSYNDSDDYSKTITKLNKFRGVFNVFSLNGQNLGSITIDQGKARNISEGKTLDFLAETINLFDTSPDITKKIPLCDGTYTQVVEQAQDVWRVVSLGPKILSVEYEYTKVTRTTTILPYPCDGSGDRDAIILQRTAQYSRSFEGLSAPQITSGQELSNLINNTYADAYAISFFQNKNQVIASTSFNLLPWVGVRVVITQNIGKTYSIEAVNTELWGFSFATSWKTTTYVQNVVGNITTLTITGVAIVGTGVEGVGDVYAEQVTYEIKINNTDGRIQSGKRIYLN